VGKDEGSDFYTATTLGPVFGELIAEAASTLVTTGQATFVEVGAEAGRTVLDGIEHPFASVQAVSIEEANEPLALPAHTVLFSNELFDAQPFERLIMTENSWAERRVRVTGEVLTEVRRPLTRDLGITLPAEVAPGYQFDLPLAAGDLVRQLTAGDWQGAFIALDYGLPWDILSTERPQGTARTYHQHQVGSDLLAHPGEDDITCHVCWDWLEAALKAAGFREVRVMRQEAFLLQLAPQTVSRIVTGADAFSEARQTLKALLHPHHLGSKFQALIGVR